MRGGGCVSRCFGLITKGKYAKSKPIYTYKLKSLITSIIISIIFIKFFSFLGIITSKLSISIISIIQYDLF